MRSRYPVLQPYATHRISVDAPHEIYAEECGNPRGIPILYIHGGPGSGCSPESRCFFDPNIYRIILFDQRGAGQSTPHAELRGNTIQALVSDMEAIRKKLEIKNWILFGGSWGSTLALVYAETHPQNVMGLILRGIFLARQEDLDWMYGNQGACRIFPDYWEEFLAPIPPPKRSRLLSAYYDLLTSKNEIQCFTAAKAWSNWEGRIAHLEPNPKFQQQLTEPLTALSFSRIECHYFLNHCFLEANQILNNAHKIKHIPTIIIHGRYDMICPFDNAWRLHKALANSELEIIRNAGHSASEAGITDALIRATQKMPNLLTQ